MTNQALSSDIRQVWIQSWHSTPSPLLAGTPRTPSSASAQDRAGGARRSVLGVSAQAARIKRSEGCAGGLLWLCCVVFPGLNSEGVGGVKKAGGGGEGKGGSLPAGKVSAFKPAHVL